MNIFSVLLHALRYPPFVTHHYVIILLLRIYERGY